MGFVILQDEDGKDFITSTSNIVSITPGAKDIVLEVNKGPHVKTDYSQSLHMQAHFNLKAGKLKPEEAAIELARDIAHHEKTGTLFDLRDRAPPPRKKEPYDPGQGW